MAVDYWSPEVDVRKSDPPAVEPYRFDARAISCFGLSLRGSSHVENGTPCQDCSNAVFLKEAGVVVSAVADGVGSCGFSQWGSRIAIDSALDYICAEIAKISRGAPLAFAGSGKMRGQVERITEEAFECAVGEIERFAKAKNIAKSSLLDTTLTIAVYDGSSLLVRHSGDGGVVAQFDDGTVEMVTERCKGEAANSVVVLRERDQWRFYSLGIGKDGPRVAAFAMATDGMLDSFVKYDSVHREMPGCCRGVYYPFMGQFLYDYSDRRRKVRSASSGLDRFLQAKDAVQCKVSDDVTFVLAFNPELVLRSNFPDFDEQAWEEARKRLRDELYEQGPVGLRRGGGPRRGGLAPGALGDSPSENCSDFESEEELKLEQIKALEKQMRISNWLMVALCVLLVVCCFVGVFATVRILGEIDACRAETIESVQNAQAVLQQSSTAESVTNVSSSPSTSATPTPTPSASPSVSASSGDTGESRNAGVQQSEATTNSGEIGSNGVEEED